MQNEPKRQHWVPKTYLRRFSPDGDGVHVYDTLKRREFFASMDKVLVQKHLYTIGAKNPAPLYTVEETLSKFETWASPSLECLADGKSINSNPTLRRYFAVFLSTLLMRNPRLMNLQEKYLGQAEELRSPSAAITPEEYEEVANWYRSLDVEGRHIFYVRSILDTALALAEDILNKKWNLFCAAQGFFLTSDNPLVVFHPSEAPHGIGTPGVQIHIAITPKILLLIGSEVDLDDGTLHSMPQKMVDYINYFTAWRAERYIVSHRPFGSSESTIQAARKDI